MNKAEEWIKAKLQKQFLKDCHINPYDAPKLLQLYADEQSREEAIEFGRWKQQSRYELMPSDYAEFVEWREGE